MERVRGSLVWRSLLLATGLAVAGLSLYSVMLPQLIAPSPDGALGKYAQYWALTDWLHMSHYPGSVSIGVVRCSWCSRLDYRDHFATCSSKSKPPDLSVADREIIYWESVGVYYGEQGGEQRLMFSLWYGVALGLLYPTWRILIWVWRRWRRRDYPACSRCRYDLTGNTTGVCPECGQLAPLTRTAPTLQGSSNTGAVASEPRARASGEQAPSVRQASTPPAPARTAHLWREPRARASGQAGETPAFIEGTR